MDSFKIGDLVILIGDGGERDVTPHIGRFFTIASNLTHADKRWFRIGLGHLLETPPGHIVGWSPPKYLMKITPPDDMVNETHTRELEHG